MGNADLATHILFSGQLAAGKDTAADHLHARLGPPWERAALADAVKDIYASAFGVTREFIEAWKRNPEPPPGMEMNVRKGLQFIGDGFRTIKSTCWMDIAFQRPNRIFSDGRYVNEARAVKRRNGYSVLVYRPGFMNDDPNQSEAQIRPVVEWCVQTGQNGPINFDVELNSYLRCGVTEDIVANYDYFLYNSGTVEQLHASIDANLLPVVRRKFL